MQSFLWFLFMWLFVIVFMIICVFFINQWHLDCIFNVFFLRYCFGSSFIVVLLKPFLKLSISIPGWNESINQSFFILNLCVFIIQQSQLILKLLYLPFKECNYVFVLINLIKEDHTNIGRRDVTDFISVRIAVRVLFVGLDTGLLELNWSSELDYFGFVPFQDLDLLDLGLLEDLLEHKVAASEGVILLHDSEVGGF
jgi:hypothetical protein